MASPRSEPGPDEVHEAPSRPWWASPLPAPPRADLAAAAALAALVLVVFWKLLAGRVLYERDIAVLFHPQAEAFFAAIRAGSWPVWNPFAGFGEPMLANANTQSLYPPTWLLLVLPPATYYSAYVIAHLVFGGIGLYALARQLGASRPAALTGAAVFLVCGPVLSLVNIWNHLAGACWMSWVVLAAVRAVRSCTSSAALVWGVVVAAQVLAGSPDMCALTLAATLGAWAAEGPRVLRQHPARALAGTVALAALTATVLSAAQWLPTLAAARAGSRGAMPFEARAFWSVHPLSLAQLVAPLPFLELAHYSPRGGELFDVWEPFLASLYLGSAAAGLAAAALSAPRARRARTFALFAVLALVLALGRHTPVYEWLIRVAPPLAMFRFPAKVMVLVAWSWALLVALGAEEWWRDPAGSWRRTALPAAGVLTASLTLAAILVAAAAARRELPLLGPAAAGGEQVAHHAAAALARAAVTAALSLLGLAAARHGGRRMAAAAMLVAVADLALAHRDLNPTAPAAFYRYRPEALRLLPNDPPPRVFVWDYVQHRPSGQPPLLSELMQVREGWPEGLGRNLGLQAYLYPPSYARWRLHGSFDRDLLGLTPRHLGYLVALLSHVHGTPAYPHLLRLGAVDAVLALHDEAPAGLRPLGVVDAPFRVPVRAYAVPDPRPRAFLVGEATVAEEDEPALRILLDPGFDVSRRVLLAQGAEASPPSPLQGTLQVTRDVPDGFEAEIDLDRAGFLVRVVTYDPGWRVRLDGARAPLLRANYAFQAVSLPAGRHRVSMVYRPRPILAGLALSALALVTVVVLLIRSRPPRPRPSAARDALRP